MLWQSGLDGLYVPKRSSGVLAVCQHLWGYRTLFIWARDARDRVENMIEKAWLAGGCFWGMQDLIRKQTGVVSTRVGYTGGEAPNPTYEMLKTGTSGHAESIEIEFDSAVVSFREILALFFKIHDPTTIDRQGNDIGSQYRSAIFYMDDTQRDTAKQVIADAEATGRWPGKFVTELTPATEFWEAEAGHQDYLERFPNGYTCHRPRVDWVLD